MILIIKKGIKIPLVTFKEWEVVKKELLRIFKTILRVKIAIIVK
jgi:hypothetical protein